MGKQGEQHTAEGQGVKKMPEGLDASEPSELNECQSGRLDDILTL